MERIGPYQVVGELGRGAMGVVYRVLDPHVAERQLAVKLITADLQQASGLERFLREAEVLARVHHGGVVRVHGLARTPRGAYLVTEVVEGPLLKDVIKEEGPPGPRESARIVRELADAVGAVHRAGILHRDLKPSNVILRDGAPVLLDFGVARDLDAETLTRTGALLGTPAYMSPEQAAGERVGPPTDVYGLGAILYELLAGRPPFQGAPIAVLKQVLEGEPVWPRALGVEVPPGLEAVLRKALAKLPQDRYPSAEALRDDLDRYLAGRPAEGGGAGVGAPRLALGAVLALGLVAALGVGLSGGPGPGETPPPASPPNSPVRAEPTPKPTPDDGLLWRLEPGDAFRARIVFDERSGSGQIRMDSVLAAVVERVEDGVAELELTTPEIAVRSEPIVGDRAALDRRAAASDPLSPVLQAAMAPFRCTIDLRSGAVTMDGLETIHAGIRRQKPAIAEIERRYSDLLEDGGAGAIDPGELMIGSLIKIFSGDYLGASLDAVARVQDGKGPWEPDPETPGGYTYEARDMLVLPFVGLPEDEGPLVARIQGRSIYAGGRLQVGEMTQSLVKRPDDTLRWSWTLIE